MIFGPPNLSHTARRILTAALDTCVNRYSALPQWHVVRVAIGGTDSDYYESFDELCNFGVISEGVPSTIDALEAFWPLGRQGRPMAHEWRVLRAEVFGRDDFTCQYCGVRGGKLECDHVVPVSKGGPSVLDNLATACFSCNRSKRSKTIAEWIG